MGNQYSQGPHPLDNQTLSSADLTEYEKACALDPDVQKFDRNLKYRTEKALISLAKGVDESGLSFDSLKDVTATFLELDEEVANIILSYKKDIWASESLFEIVKEYFDNSLATLEFCSEVSKCIKRTKENQMLIQYALSLMSEEDNPSESTCERVLEELHLFIQAGNPFSESFMDKFQTVYQRQIELQKKLQAKKKKLDRKLKFVKGWIKVSTIILAATCAGLLICTLVAAAMSVPAIAIVVAGVSAMPLESMGRWYKSLLSKYQKEIEARRDLIQEQNKQTFIIIKELDAIKMIIMGLQEEIKSIMRHIKFGKDHKDLYSVLLVVEKLRENQLTLIRDLDILEEHVDHCTKTIYHARTVVLRGIMRRKSKIGVQPSK